MSEVPNGKRFVTWKEFVVCGLPVIAVSITVSWFLMESHTERLHNEMATKSETNAIIREAQSMQADIDMIMQFFMQKVMTDDLETE